LEGAGMGMAGGAVLGGVSGLVGKVFKKKAEIVENPETIVPYIGEKKSLETYVASRPNLSLQQVPTLGKDLEGNNIVSRLEWDHRNEKGYLIMTPNATDESLAHEVGHYIEKMYPDFPKRFETEIKAVSGGTGNLNEDFAHTVSRVFLDEGARVKAPTLAQALEDEVKIELSLPKEKTLLDAPVRQENTLLDAPVKDFERAKGLSGEDVKIESAAYDKILKKEAEILNDYKEKNGNVVNADSFRPYFKEEGYAGHNSAAVQEPSSYLAKRAYAEGLKNDGPFVTFFAGGSGVGKTSAIKNISKANGIIKDSSVVLDGNFSSYSSAMKKIEQAAEAGKKVKILYVYRDPSDAFVNGVVKRMLNNPEEMGRLVPAKVVAENHIGSWETVKRLHKEGYDVVFVDNSLGAGKAKTATFEELDKKIRYGSAEELTKVFDEKAKELLDDKTITKEQYRGYVGAKEKPVAEQGSKASEQEASKKVAIAEKPRGNPVVEAAAVNSKKFGPTPRKKVKSDGVNWKSINTSEETEDILRSVFDENKQFQKVRPSRSNQDIIEGARAVGIDPNNEAEMKALLKNMPNANVAVKLKQMMVDSASDLMNYLKTVDTGTLTAEQQKAVRDKFLRTQAIAETFAGLRTEASHLLRSMGIEVMEGENMAEMAQKMKQILGETGDNPLAFMGKVQKEIKPTKMDTYQGIWYNTILSGWKTWARNMMDNTAHLITETVSKASNPKTIKESTHFVAGLLRAMPESMKKAFDVLKGAKQVDSKIEYTKKLAPYFKSRKLNFWLTEVSGRVLSAQDAAFSTMAEEAVKAVDTFSKQAKKAGISESDAVRLNDAMTSQFAERVTYRNKPLGKIGALSSGISGIVNKVPELRFIIPFVRVVANVTDRKIDYLPFANLPRTFGKKYLSEEADVILKKSGISPSKWDALRPVVVNRLKDQQLGRLYLGTLVSVAAYGLAANDLITGNGPENANERKQLQDTGWRPYSLKIGDTWVPFSYFGPLSGVLAAAGSIGDSLKYGKSDDGVMDKAAGGVFGFAKNLLSNSFLQGVSDLFDVMSGRLDYKKYARDMAASLVPIPAMWTQTVTAIDGRSFDTQTLGEAVQYKLGITKDLTPRLNALGEEIRSDFIYGLTPSSERENLSKEFEKRDVVVNVPAKSTKLGDREMTREELFRYTKIRGELIKNYSESILIDLDDAETQDDRESVFKAWIEDISQEAKAEME
jgi:D-Tyr-tRNAtyr deacylase